MNTDNGIQDDTWLADQARDALSAIAELYDDARSTLNNTKQARETRAPGSAVDVGLPKSQTDGAEK